MAEGGNDGISAYETELTCAVGGAEHICFKANDLTHDHRFVQKSYINL